jgi:hypothetical protein
VNNICARKDGAALCGIYTTGTWRPRRSICWCSSARTRRRRMLLVRRRFNYLAAQQGYVEARNVLVEFGANKEAMNVGRQTALHVAAGQGHVDAMRVLVQLGTRFRYRRREQGREGYRWADGATLGGRARGRGGDQGVGAARRGQRGEGCVGSNRRRFTTRHSTGTWSRSRCWSSSARR